MPRLIVEVVSLSLQKDFFSPNDKGASGNGIIAADSCKEL